MLLLDVLLVGVPEGVPVLEGELEGVDVTLRLGVNEDDGVGVEVKVPLVLSVPERVNVGLAVFEGVHVRVCVGVSVCVLEALVEGEVPLLKDAVGEEVDELVSDPVGVKELEVDPVGVKELVVDPVGVTEGVKEGVIV